MRESPVPALSQSHHGATVPYETLWALFYDLFVGARNDRTIRQVSSWAPTSLIYLTGLGQRPQNPNPKI